MITDRALQATLPRNRLFTDMAQFYYRASGTGCRVGVYKTDWNEHCVPDWHWWCPGCQRRGPSTNEHFPIKCQDWGKTWEWAMQKAWDHVREVHRHDGHDESVASDNYS